MKLSALTKKMPPKDDREICFPVNTVHDRLKKRFLKYISFHYNLGSLPLLSCVNKIFAQAA